VDVRGATNSSYRNASVVFGYQDANNYYHANFCGNSSNAAYNGIFKVTGGTETRIATGAASLTDTTAYHHVRVTWDGATGVINAYFDVSSTPMFSVTDHTITSGQVGLWSKTKQGYFDNVEVVSRIRIDSFGSSGIRGPHAMVNNLNSMVYPNPFILGSNPALLQGVKLFDAAGREVAASKIVKSGIYFVKEKDSLRRIVIVK
jgi:hypothetical protein